MGRPSKTKNQKKERASAQHRSQEEYGSVPHSFVFHRGRIGKNIQQLIQDVRRVMEPFSATSLKVKLLNAIHVVHGNNCFTGSARLTTTIGTGMSIVDIGVIF
ncbi:PREDICTED: suppressor of SWI4 1 homolog [Thamnophis sirtalis]|uniref:Suppressor of SWI4 1 homolog n=1 Tax=Thamnophis sirtalis TaxID=35019 RepID=A0A6I9Z1E0_9SAUR|nr:PREDICTED: suppressor of SWI4 1 homolog [Thamnophis sirtalis]